MLTSAFALRGTKPGQEQNNNKMQTHNIIIAQSVLSLLNIKTKIPVMKKIYLLSVSLILFAGISQAQRTNGMRNRSVWKDSPAKQDTSVQESPQVDQSAEQDTAKHLNEVVVTGSRTEKTIDQVGRSISVISAEDIRRSGANTPAEVLNMAEGIYVAGGQQNFGANQSLFMRGANSNQSVVMIDGMVIADPSTPTGALDLSELSLAEIDHIEIVRGSHSTLYGSSAIGGVINIITNKKQKQGLNLNATGTAGTFGDQTSLIGQNIGMNYTCKSGLYANLNLNNVNSNGIDATVDTMNGKGMPHDKDGMTRFDYGGRVGYKSNMWDLSVTQKVTQTHADIDSREFKDDDNSTLDFQRKMLSYGASCKLDSGFIIAFNGGHSTTIRTLLNDSSRTDNAGHYDHSYSRGVYTGETYSNELQLQIKQKNWSAVLGGALNDQFMSQDVYAYYSGFATSSNLDSIEASHTASFFILTELKGSLISEKLKALSVSMGARNNSNNTFGGYTTYQFNPMVKISATSTLYANISTGYNAPSLYELHSPDRDVSSFISRGNVNLRPETSVTREFGLYQKINDKTGVRISYFKTVIRDVIEYVYLWDKNIGLDTLGNNWMRNDFRGDTYLNLGTITTEGIELEAHGAIGNKFLVSGNFSYLKGTQDFASVWIDTVKTEGNHVQLFNNGSFLTDKVQSSGLTRRPVTANFTLTYMLSSRVFFKGVMKYVSKRNDVIYDSGLGPYGAFGKIPVQSYTLFDVIMGVKFNDNISGLLRVENIFNEQYTEIRGYASRGRGLFVSINYRF